MDFVVIYSTEFQILKSNVVIYREDYGGEIGSPRWLSQFEGKNSVGKGIEINLENSTVLNQIEVLKNTFSEITFLYE